jgi:lysophospholipase L1-like esterase
MSKERERTTIQNNDHHKDLEMMINKGIKPDILLIGTSMFGRMVFVNDAKEMYNKHGLNDHAILNLGAGGDKIRNILWRCEDHNGGILEAVRKHCIPKTIIVMGGANDVETVKPNKMINLFTELLGLVKNKFPESRIVVVGMFPRFSDMRSIDSIMKSFRAYNEGIKKIAPEYYYFGESIMQKDGYPDRQYFATDDPVHLNKKGYDIFCKGLRQIITGVIEITEITVGYIPNDNDFPALG